MNLIPDPPDVEQVPYSILRTRMDTGDVVLFVGTGWWSRVIQFGTRSSFSHVGWVYRVGDTLLISESAKSSGVRDAFAGKFIDGVQTVSLSARLQTYKGRIYWRRLGGNVRTDHFRENAENIRRMYSGLKYERSWRQFLGAVFKSLKRQENRIQQFCSEYLAIFFQDMDLLMNPRPSNQWTPGDWSHAEADAGIVWLKPSWTLSPEIEVKPDMGVTYHPISD